MGVRINKIMGYGISNLKLDAESRWDITDSRINQDSRLLNAVADDSTNFSGYESFISQHSLKERVPSITPEVKSFMKNPLAAVTLLVGTDIKKRDEGILLFTPVSITDRWVHKDDLIDYYSYRQEHLHEDQLDDDILTPSVQELSLNPYPFNEDYVDTRTRKRVNPQLWNLTQRLYESGEIEMANEVAFLSNFEDAKHMYDNVAPRPPKEIEVLIEWLNVFNNPGDTIKELKPMIVTYWQ
jgi:hypothetical protein